MQFDILTTTRDTKGYPTVTSDHDSTIQPGPDDVSGLYQLARTKDPTSFVGHHPIEISGLADTGADDILVRAILKRTPQP